MSIVTLPDAKQQLRIPDSDTSQDEKLQGYVDGITAAIEEKKGVVLEARTVTDEISAGRGVNTVTLSSIPVISLTSTQSLDGTTTWDVGNLHVNTKTGKVTVLTGPPLSGTITVTYQAGYQTVPDNYVRAALVVLQHNWETQRGVGTRQAGVLDPADQRSTYSFPYKAMEWLGLSIPGIG